MLLGRARAWRSRSAASCCAALGLACSVRIISTGSEALVERLGKFDRRLSPGLNFIVPGLEGVSIRASVREQVLDVPPQPCITSDNAPLSADAVVFFRIRDLALARYAVDDFRACVTNLVLTQLRSEIGQLTLDQTFAARERLNQKLLEEANAVTAGWGVDVTRIEVRDIHPSPEIVSSMEMQMAAERKMRAAILQSEGDRAAQVNAAEGRRGRPCSARAASRSGCAPRRRASPSQSSASRARCSARAPAARRPPWRSRRAQRGPRLLVERQHITALQGLASSANAKVMLFPSSARELASAAVLGDAAAGSPALGGARKSATRAPSSAFRCALELGDLYVTVPGLRGNPRAPPPHRPRPHAR